MDGPSYPHQVVINSMTKGVLMWISSLSTINAITFKEFQERTQFYFFGVKIVN